MLQLPASLAPLRALVQFVVWKAVPGEGEGKTDKLPVHWQTGIKCDVTKAANWTDVDTAIAAAARLGAGHSVGFVFTPKDPYWFLDIDGCWEPGLDGAPGKWSDLALELYRRLPGAAYERSQSGHGMHLFGRRRRPLPDHINRNKPLHLEFYTELRFVALTGVDAAGDVDIDLDDALDLILAQHFPPSPTGDFAGWTDRPVDGSEALDDDAILAMAMKEKQTKAKVRLGDEIAFADLFEANADKLAKAWAPEPGTGKPYGQSEADQSLADRLAYWTRKNCDQIERLMRRSKLVRPKWDLHRTYLSQTIMNACKLVTGIREDRAPLVPDAAAAAVHGRGLRQGGEFMQPPAQLAYFAGCFYLSDQHRVYVLGLNVIMAKTSFDVVFGGYLFVLDPGGAKPTASAWDAFTLSRVYGPTIVNDVCFRPELPPGTIVQAGKQTLVNSYVPYDCPTLDGDVTPFTDLLARQFPVEEDRRILVNYMASAIQNPGVKFPWWPVLQGAPGNGKTFLMTVMEFCIGPQYSHFPNAAALAKVGTQFNMWLHRKLWIGVEEVSLTNRRDFLDEFKPIITNRTMSFEGKGTNQFSGDNRANGMLATNHPDGVPIDLEERRYAIFYMAQQTAADLERDGMDNAYWFNLWQWFHGGGAAIIAHYLKTFPIEAAYDPAGLSNRAPRTSSFGQAIVESRGRGEQEIWEAIQEGRPGFAGGWVSSYWLDVLLQSLRIAIPLSRRIHIMASLGYILHPALPEGRVNDPVTPDQRKPKLYVRRDHALALQLTRPPDIGKAYSRAQEAGATDTSAAVLAFGSNPVLTPPSK